MAQTRNFKPVNMTLPEPFIEIMDLGIRSMPKGHQTGSAFIRGLLMRWAWDHQAQGHKLPESFLALVEEIPQPQPKLRKK